MVVCCLILLQKSKKWHIDLATVLLSYHYDYLFIMKKEQNYILLLFRINLYHLLAVMLWEFQDCQILYTTMEGKITTTNSESCTWWPFVFDLIVVKKIRKFHTHTMISVMTCAVLLLCIFFFPLFSVLLLATYFTFFCVSALFYVLPMFYFF